MSTKQKDLRRKDLRHAVDAIVDEGRDVRGGRQARERVTMGNGAASSDNRTLRSRLGAEARNSSRTGEDGALA